MKGTDLEIIDEYLKKPFINPVLLKEIIKRNLYDIVNYIDGKNYDEMRANARMRLAKRDNKYLGDPEIEWFADMIDRLIFLKNELNKIKITETSQLLDVLNEMVEISKKINDYYKNGH